MPLERWNEDVDGPFAEDALRRKLEGRGFRAERCVYESGSVFPEHAHESDKLAAVVSGRFRVKLEGRAYVLEAGDCLAVPRGVAHSAEVVGDDPVVCFDAEKS
jgi:quercetin dioxygenase-like cupin family protein